MPNIIFDDNTPYTNINTTKEDIEKEIARITSDIVQANKIDPKDYEDDAGVLELKGDRITMYNTRIENLNNLLSNMQYGRKKTA